MQKTSQIHEKSFDAVESIQGFRQPHLFQPKKK
jgi:hypothetical protein